jgi:hypothetical protein
MENNGVVKMKNKTVDDFPIGTRVKLVKYSMLEKLGKTGKVIGHISEDYDDEDFLDIQWDNDDQPLDSGGYYPSRFEKVDETSSIKSFKQSSCPRCDGELFEKRSEYDGSIVKKCKCGWCD